MKIGGVDIYGGKFGTMVLETIETAPTFNAEDVGTFTFSLDDEILRFNTGVALVALNSGASENPNLVSSLGSNWLNADLTFNPIPFNDLAGITGLTPDDSLFSVIDQITTVIDNLSEIGMGDIDVPTEGYMRLVVTMDGTMFPVDINTVIGASSVNLDFTTLSDFDIDPLKKTAGNQLVFNESALLVAKKVHYTYENTTASKTHQIYHGFGNQHCSVFCINPQTNVAMTPDSITYLGDDATNYRVLLTFEPTAVPLIAILTNIDIYN
jgi:hypothetical protein